jgi:hypothetical protein
MSQHPSQHPNYDDAASALIELAGNGNTHSAGISHDNGAIFVPGVGSSQDKNTVKGTVSQTAVSPAKPSPVAVAAANRFPGKVRYFSNLKTTCFYFDITDRWNNTARLSL